MPLSFYTSFAEDLVDAGLDWVADTIKISIHTATQTFTPTHDFYVDLANQVTGTNYTAGGMTLGSKTASAANPCVLTAADVPIAQSGGGFADGRTYIVYKVVGSAATDPLICHGTAGAVFGNVAGALTLDVPTTWISVQV